MYSFEARLRAIELYFKYGRKAAVVIRELGYPTVRHLRCWIRAWQTGGEKIECISRKPRYSDEQKQAAVEHYRNHGRCLAFTRKTLGYPSDTEPP